MAFKVQGDFGGLPDNEEFQLVDCEILVWYIPVANPRL
jgi:hypothetical protein